MSTREVIPAAALRGFVQQVLERAGMRPTDAEIVADGLVWAELRGIEPHGVAKLPVCVERLLGGGSPARAEPTVIRETETTALLDAQGAWGQLAATLAMERAVAMAQRRQVGVVVVRDSSSLGALGYYALIATRQEMIGLAITNSMALLAPWGGARKLLGNQAYAIGCPSSGLPLLLDTSNSATSWGRIRIAGEKGEQLEPGLALDREGRPTTDPAAALQGLLQPAAGHKGYGLALMWEVLTGVLAGLAFGPNVGPLEAVDRRQETSHFLLALDPAAFLPLEEFKARVDSLVEQVHQTPRAPGVERLYLPGERSGLLEVERRAGGIPLPAIRLNELRALAERFGLAPLA
jgi:LDH2 family malate/lactate/ureidoglycolate dehydrogenase